MGTFYTAVRQAMVLVGPERRWRWVLLVLLALMMTGFEALGAFLIYLLLSLIGSADGAIELPRVGDLRQAFPGISEQTLLVSVAAGISIFFLLRALFLIARTYTQSRIVENAGARLANKLVRGYMAMPYLFHTRHNSAQLVRNSYDSVKVFTQHVLSPLVTVVAEMFMVAGLLLVMVLVTPLATLLALAALGPLIWLLLRVVQPRMKRLGRRAQANKREALKAVQESLTGVRDIKLLGGERHFARAFARQRTDLARVLFTKSAFGEIPRAMIETSLILVIVVMFVVAVLGGQDLDDMLAVLGLFAYAGFRLQPSVRSIVVSLNDIRFGSAVVEDLTEDLQRVSAAMEAERMRRAGPRRTGEFSNAIEFRDVTFGYLDDGTPALSNVNLTIRRGESLGICGPTGGGKSTLVDLLTGLLEPVTGSILVDGEHLHSDPDWWRTQLGVVSQNVFLLDDTIRNNIAFGVDGEEIDEVRLERCVQRAQLAPVVEQLPEGLDTVVGEAGIRLSGGQRQRVAVARALYREPPVLVFDEGTSALDTATESALVAAIDDLRETSTVVTVAHRLSTVRRADRILVIDRGRIDTMGSYAELLSDSELFRTLAT
jgi:ATP-binding cassette, subfamily B, bacterial PglK